ncbi:MAG: hypothetical protein K0U24_05805 [Gammaproteobacteria bacterium]|nr:hypothetical protein [Gammaproteobacteria bacterium]
MMCLELGFFLQRRQQQDPIVPLLHPLLTHISKDEQEKAKNWIISHPHHLSYSAQFEDYTNRDFISVSPFQLALWYKDIDMCHMMIDSASDDTRLPLFRQYDELKAQGAPYLMHPVLYVMGTEEATLWPKDNLGAFNINPLLNAYQLLINNFYAWRDNPSSNNSQLDTLCNHWRRGIGALQRRLPYHFIQEMIREDLSLDYNAAGLFEACLPSAIPLRFEGNILPITTAFTDYNQGKILCNNPLDQRPGRGLGVSFALTSGVYNQNLTEGLYVDGDILLGLSIEELQTDMEGLRILDQIKTNEIDNMLTRLTAPRISNPEPLDDSSNQQCVIF